MPCQGRACAPSPTSPSPSQLRDAGKVIGHRGHRSPDPRQAGNRPQRQGLVLIAPLGSSERRGLCLFADLLTRTSQALGWNRRPFLRFCNFILGFRLAGALGCGGRLGVRRSASFCLADISPYTSADPSEQNQDVGGPFGRKVRFYPSTITQLSPPSRLEMWCDWSQGTSYKQDRLSCSKP